MFEPVGNPGGILFLKAGPSKTDEGAVFTSKSGHLLRKWTSDITVPVMLDYFCYEPAWRAHIRKGHTSAIADMWKTHFLSRLKAHKPKAIVLFGDELLPMLTDHWDLLKTYCYVLRINKLAIPIIPTFPLEDVYIPQFGPEDDEDDDTSLSSSETKNVACERQFWIKCAIEKAKKIAVGTTKQYPTLITDNKWPRIEHYLKQALASSKVCLDIETVCDDQDAPNWQLSAFSVSLNAHSAMAVTPDVGVLEWRLALSYLAQILANPAIMKVGQNWMGFDQTVLARNYGFSFAGNLWETMASFSLLFPDFKKGLGEQARMLLDVEPWKGYHNAVGDTLRLYAAKDTLYTMQLQEIHEQLLSDFDQLDHFKQYVMPMENLAFKIQQQGLKVDLAYKAKIADQIETELSAIKDRLAEFADDKVALGQRKKEKRDPKNDTLVNLPQGVELPPAGVIQKWKKKELEELVKQVLQVSDTSDYYVAKKQDSTKNGLIAGRIYKKNYVEEITAYKRAFNPNSPDQLKSVFANLKIKLPKVKKSKGVWGESTNVKSLLQMLRDGRVTGGARNFCETLLDFRKLEKLRSVYVNCALDADGRWRCAYSVSGAGTGRSSSRQTAFKTGGNIQNFPRSEVNGIKIKRLFVADPGKVLVQRDQSQAELRLVAYLAECSKLIELIETKQDAHVYSINAALGEDITKYKDTDPKKYKLLRTCGKTKNFAGMYGTGYKTLYEIFLKDKVDVSLDMCKLLMEKHRETFPEIFEIFQQEVRDQLNTDRTLVTPFGRKRRFFGPLDDFTYRKAYAHVPQSTVPYLTNLQWRWLDAYASNHPEMGIEVLSMIHDALLWQMREEYVEECRRAFDEYSQSVVLSIKGYKIVMPWDISTGHSWGDLS